MRTSRALAPILLMFVLSAACSEEAPPPVVTPSSAFPGGTGPTAPTGTGPTGFEETGPTGPTAVLPTTSPGQATGNLSNGVLSLRVTGDVDARKQLTNLISAVYTPPPGGLAVVWTAGGVDATTVGIGGASFVGTQSTSPSLSLTLTVMDGTSIASFTSLGGECTVTVLVASQSQLSGRFGCDRLVGSGGETVSVSGAFDAVE